ncbi:MAG: radical SAM protein [Deltaproteobacteria bacterium]|nr:radical SAM protein [Deltaproteobacteria bacterium]
MEFKAKLTKAATKAAAKAANMAWPVVQKVNHIKEGKPFQPKWAPAPLLKSKERTFPPLGWPRETDSLCPKCVKEARDAILSGARDWRYLIDGKPGEIKAMIVERDGKIVMEKECAAHGKWSDVMSIDPAFMRRLERLYPGRDYKAPATHLRDHGSSSIQFGRGSVLTVDLTNRCNMMCDPCFMDANQVGYVHELQWDDVKQILDNAVSIKPRRQLSVQFSGGEPTISPFFLDAIRYSKEVGYFCVQAATNGIRFAQEPEFAKEAAAAGLRIAYLQFDGVTNEANMHRKIGNLFDVKLRAIENLAAAKIDVVLVVTVVNGVNNHQVGPILDFAVKNPDKVTVISFQPVSFTGRDEDVDNETRAAQRYTLSHLAHDVKRQTGVTEPMRDWFPLSALGPFSDLVDLLQGENADWGSMKCGCHPNCGIGTILFVNKKTREMVPLMEILNMEQLLRDIQEITDANRGEKLTKAQLALSVLRNFNADKAPKGLELPRLLKQMMSQMGANSDGLGKRDADAFEWRALFVAGMWFQDLFNYDFRRTEMCIIPYGTQLGEISFCAYNTGAGWRQIIEKMMMNATTADWYRQHGKHDVYAKWQHLELPNDAPVTSWRPTGDEEAAIDARQGAFDLAGTPAGDEEKKRETTETLSTQRSEEEEKGGRIEGGAGAVATVSTAAPRHSEKPQSVFLPVFPTP